MSLMPGQPSIQYPGATYHVMSRGNGEENICLDDVDCHDIRKAPAEASRKKCKVMV
jgi:hypothetical protein